MSKPKAILFDIGGVCVLSPMQAIQDYEIANGIPKDYINFAISQTSPNGAWHKLERGEIKMDDSFFAQFKADLHQQHIWERYHSHFKNRRRQPTLAEAAKANASQLGDPTSLKAETSSRVPTPGEAGAGPSVSLATTARSSGGSALKESYQKNLLGDPTSLKNEGSASEPVGMQDQATGYEKGGEADGARGVGRSGSSGSASGGSGSSSLQQSYKKNMLGDPTSLKNEGSNSDPLPDQQDTGYSKDEPYPSMTSHTRSLVPSKSTRPSDGGNSLKQSYKKNMLGDPTSLKNEGSSSEPLSIQQDTGYSKDDSSSVPHSTQHTRSLVAGRPSSSQSSQASSSSSGGNSLKQSYKKNMLGDPTSLKNEGSSTDPLPSSQATGYPKDPSPSLPHSSPHSRSLSGYATSTQSSPSSTHTSLRQSYKKNLLGDPTSLKNEGSPSSPLPTSADTGYPKPDSSPSIPPIPTIDTTTLFWSMMRVSRTPDPHMFPALRTLRTSSPFILGALSNTVIFPPSHPYSRPDPSDPNDIHSQFDVFVSSAHVGLRKPDLAIYKMAVDELDKFSRSKGGSGVAPADVVFLDDIGANLKAARECGLRTIRVRLGRVGEAVRELEEVTGVRLGGDMAKL